MLDYLKRNREGLGINLLSNGVTWVLSALFVYLWWNAPADSEWRVLYGLALVVFFVVAFILCFVPAKDLLPATEADLAPLSAEAEHILRVTVRDDHLSFRCLKCFGMKGNLYGAKAVKLCDGDDALESAKYDAAVQQLLHADYVRTNNGNVYFLTSKGVDRANSLLAQASAPEPATLRATDDRVTFAMGGKVQSKKI